MELWAGRGKGKPEESDESEKTEEEVRKKKFPPRRTSRDLVGKKKTSGKETTGKGRESRKGGVLSTVGVGKKVLPKKVPSRKDSNKKHMGGKGLPGTGVRGFQCGPEYYTTDDQGQVFDQYGHQILEMMKSKQWRSLVMRKLNREQRKGVMKKIVKKFSWQEMKWVKGM